MIQYTRNGTEKRSTAWSKKLKKIDKNSRFMGLDSEINKLLSIKTYYENLQVELKNEKYKSIGVDF